MVSQSVATNIEDIKRATFWRDLAACCFLVKIQLTIPLLMNVVMVALYKPVGEKSEWPLPRVLILGVVLVQPGEKDHNLCMAPIFGGDCLRCCTGSTRHSLRLPGLVAGSLMTGLRWRAQGIGLCCARCSEGIYNQQDALASHPAGNGQISVMRFCPATSHGLQAHPE